LIFRTLRGSATDAHKRAETAPKDIVDIFWMKWQGEKWRRTWRDTADRGDDGVDDLAEVFDALEEADGADGADGAEGCDAVVGVEDATRDGEADDDHVEQVPALAEEGVRPVRGEVDEQINGEEGREEDFQDLEHGGGGRGRRSLHLRLDDVDDEVGEYEEGHQAEGDVL
jgi:hypothetical protein